MQALQYEAILEGIWCKLRSTSVKCELSGVQEEVSSVK